MKILYAYRGWILGAMAGTMLALPGMPISDDWFDMLPLPTLCLIAFVLLRVQARRIIGEHTRGFSHDADRLVTEGVYSRIRHPLYLSNAGVGYAFVVLHFGFALVALAFVVALFAFEYLLSRMEDRYLENRFGEEWRTWAAETPAFFPRLSGSGVGPSVGGQPATAREGSATGSAERSAKTPARRSFAAAFKADTSTWLWLLVMIAVVVGRKFLG